jgi:hypothetical protein
MTSAGYLTRDPDTGRFALPPGYAPVVAEEGGPRFFGGPYEQLLAMGTIYDRLTEAFRRGGGVPARLRRRFDEGMERFIAGWFNNYLVQAWLPAMADVHTSLEHGADLAGVMQEISGWSARMGTSTGRRSMRRWPGSARFAWRFRTRSRISVSSASAGAAISPSPPAKPTTPATGSSAQPDPQWLHTAQENSDVERPVFPSYWMPNALIRE